jgi:hypothetical protein
VGSGSRTWTETCNNIRTNIMFLYVIHRPAFVWNTQRFGDWILSPSSGTTYWVGPSRCLYGKVRFPSTQQTWLYNQCIIRLNFIWCLTATLFGSHGTIIRHYYDRTAKVIELQNMYPYLVQHVHIIRKVMPKLERKNYNTDLLKILKVYK